MKSWTILMPCVVLMLAGCTSLNNQIQPEAQGDAVIATMIKTKLIAAPQLAAAAIHVEADRGIVTLTGFVENNFQRQQAENLAQTISGVSQVINRIEMKW